MAYKLINANDVRNGTAIIIDNVACIAKKVDISKTGKHGHAKARIEAVGIIDGKKRILVKPGHERFEVPLIEKKRGQVLSIKENIASIMDSESYETLDVPFNEELREELKEGAQVEYWIIEEEKIIKRKL